MVREQAAMHVSIEIQETDKKLRAYFSSACQKASGIPLTAISHRTDSLRFQLMSQIQRLILPAR